MYTVPAVRCGNQEDYGFSFGQDLIKCEYFSPTDPVGCLRPGDDRKRCHLPHHPWLFCRVWRWGRLQLGAVVECLQRVDRWIDGWMDGWVGG